MTADRPAVLALRDVSFRYAAGAPWAVDGCTLDVPAGLVVGIAGANGSGKSTLARLMQGLLRPASGTVTVDGLDTARTPVRRLAAHAGYVAQNPNHQLFASTVAAELAFGPRNLGLPRRRGGRPRRRRGGRLRPRGRARSPPVSPRPGEAEAGDDRVGAGDADAGARPRRADDGAGPSHVRRHRPPDPGASRCRDGRRVHLPRRPAARRRRRPARRPRRRPRDRRRRASRRVRRRGRDAQGQAPAAAGDAARAPARRPGSGRGRPCPSTRSPGRCARARLASPPRPRPRPDDLVPAGSRCAGLRPRGLVAPSAEPHPQARLAGGDRRVRLRVVRSRGPRPDRRRRSRDRDQRRDRRAASPGRSPCSRPSPPRSSSCSRSPRPRARPAARRSPPPARSPSTRRASRAASCSSCGSSRWRWPPSSCSRRRTRRTCSRRWRGCGCRTCST